MRSPSSSLAPFAIRPHVALGLALLALSCGAPEDRPTESVPAQVEPAEAPPPLWGQWRGTDGKAVADDTELPMVWSGSSPNVRWRAPVEGKGNSSPVVAHDRVFLTSTRPAGSQQLDRLVLGFDLATGTPLFSTVVFSDAKYRAHHHNSNAGPSPATDGKAVYAFFGSTLAAIGLSGDLLWSQQVDPGYREHAHWGAASSLEVFENLVILLQDNEDAKSGIKGWLAAFDTATGAQVWRQEWEDTCCSYTTPLIWRRTDDVDLVIAHSGWVKAYDPRTGEPRWSHPYEINQFVPSPAFQDDVLCTLGGAHNVKGNACFRVTGRGVEAKVERLWWDTHSAPEVASPVLYDGKLFAVTTKGIMSSYDPLDGSLRWRDRLPTKSHLSSLVAGDGKIYAVAISGRTIVIDAAAPELTVLAMNELDDTVGSTASPAIAGGCILIRTSSYLHCIES